jgi:glutathione-independent formaldehyde dehydrogenase
MLCQRTRKRGLSRKAPDRQSAVTGQSATIERNSQQSISFRRRSNIDGYHGLPMPSPPILHYRMSIDGCFSAKTRLIEPRRFPMAAGNRAITFLGPHKMPFNVACCTCQNCKERHTDVCLNANEELGFCGAYGFNLGGWQGGQAEYMLVPWADFQLLKFPDKEQAMEKIRDLTLLSDILPTGYHGCIEARVGTGSTVYIAGAGPVGRCAAASAQLLGASCIIVGDHNKARRDLVKEAGYEVVDPSSTAPVADQIEKLLGTGSRWVDAAVDCVGLECHGYGPDESSKNVEEAVINTLMEVIKPAGAMGIPGVYTNLDPGAATELNKKGLMALGFPAAWVKSPTFTAGQCPVMHYNRDLMMAILWDRMPYLTPLLNTEVIPLERAVEAYQIFHDGSPKKFVIDPHNMTKLMSTGQTGERAKVHASAHH